MFTLAPTPVAPVPLSAQKSLPPTMHSKSTTICFLGPHLIFNAYLLSLFLYPILKRISKTTVTKNVLLLIHLKYPPSKHSFTIEVPHLNLQGTGNDLSDSFLSFSENDA